MKSVEGYTNTCSHSWLARKYRPTTNIILGLPIVLVLGLFSTQLIIDWTNGYSYICTHCNNLNNECIDIQ